MYQYKLHSIAYTFLLSNKPSGFEFVTSGQSLSFWIPPVILQMSKLQLREVAQLALSRTESSTLFHRLNVSARM